MSKSVFWGKVALPTAKCKITVGLRRKNRDIEYYFGAKNCTLVS